MSATRLRPIAVSALLAALGAFALVGLRALQIDELHWAFFLFATLIGAGVAGVADPRSKRVRIAAIAAAGAWICGLAGNLSIALLERRASSAEFDLRALSRPDFFIALEAYKLSHAKKPAGTQRPFTGATRREHYDDATWRAAVASWSKKSEAEKEAIGTEWRRAYEKIEASMTARVVDSIVGSLFLAQYAIGAVLAAAIAAVYDWDS